MPIRFVCAKCGKLLYEDVEPNFQHGKAGNNTLRKTYMDRILELLGEKCPYCGHRFRVPPEKVEVYPIRKKFVQKFRVAV